MASRLLVFDFDGTIADSYTLIICALENYLGRELDGDSLRNLSTRQVVDTLGLRTIELPKVTLFVRRYLKSQAAKIEPAQGVLDAIRTLHEKNPEDLVVLLSSNSTENISSFLKRHDSELLFSKVFTGNTIFGKAGKLKRVMRSFQREPKDTIYVGDETRDIVAANQVGAKSVAVCWGYNSKSTLIEFNPDFLVNDPTELGQL